MSRFTVLIYESILETQIAIAQWSDVRLLEELCSSENDILVYTLFVNRFLPELETECEKICKARKLDLHVGKQIAHETFERVRKYKSFKKDQINLPDEHKAVFVYLTRISIRLFNDHYTKTHKQEVIHKTYFDDILNSIVSPIDVKKLKNIKDISVLIFKKLNVKEQIVVLKDIEYKKHQKYLPDDVTESLASELNIKKDTIRKIRLRAIEKIKAAIYEINQN